MEEEPNDKLVVISHVVLGVIPDFVLKFTSTS